MAPTRELSDPWAVNPAAAGADRERHRLARPGVAWLIANGVLIEVWRFGRGPWRDLLLASALGLAMEVAIRARRDASRAGPVLRVAAVVLLTAVASRTIGATPAVLLAAAVVIADAAVVSWRPLPAWPQRSEQTVTLAVGALVAAELTWARTGARIPTAALFAVAALAVELAGRRPTLVAVVDRGVVRATRAASTAIIRIVLLVVALVVLYLPGAVVRVLRAAAGLVRPRSDPGWQVVATSAVDDRRNALRPFTSTAAPVRAARTWRGLLVVAVATIAVVLIARQVSAPSSPDLAAGVAAPAGSVAAGGAGHGHEIFATELAVRYSDLPAYRGVAFADGLQQDEAQHVVNGTLNGTYEHIRDGQRVTKAPPSCTCPRATLWFSGGSAAFGTGQRDDHTIASDLVTLAYQQDHIALNVENISHDGYTFQMEAQWDVEQRLRTEKAPELLVFYNGWNDAMAELTAEYLHRPPSTSVRYLLPTDLALINRDSDRFLASKIGPQAGRAAAARYRNVQAEVDAAARRSGVATSYFFQADALSSARQIASYQAINGIPSSVMLASPIAQCLASMTGALGNSVINLRTLFDARPDPVFLGLVHQNERGALVVAQRIYRQLRPQIRSLAR